MNLELRNSGTQEGMALSSGLSKEQDFLGRLQDEEPFKLA